MLKWSLMGPWFSFLWESVLLFNVQEDTCHSWLLFFPWVVGTLDRLPLVITFSFLVTVTECLKNRGRNCSSLAQAFVGSYLSRSALLSTRTRWQVGCVPPSLLTGSREMSCTAGILSPYYSIWASNSWEGTTHIWGILSWTWSLSKPRAYWFDLSP